jgi:hypothetical protein
MSFIQHRPGFFASSFPSRPLLYNLCLGVDYIKQVAQIKDYNGVNMDRGKRRENNAPDELQAAKQFNRKIWKGGIG